MRCSAVAEAMPDKQVSVFRCQGKRRQEYRFDKMMCDKIIF